MVHYIVDLVPVHDSAPLEHFVSSGQQSIPLAGYQELEPGDVLGTASSPLLPVPLKALTLHDVTVEVSALAESPTAPASQTALPHSTTPDPPDEPSPELLHRIDHSQRESFFRLWNTVTPPQSSDRFRAGRGWLGSPCHSRPLHNPYHLHGRLPDIASVMVFTVHELSPRYK